MEAFVTGLTTAVTATTLWAAVAPAAALVGVGILVAFATSRLTRVVGGLGRGKAKI